MPLPAYPPVLVQAPRWAGIGLRFPIRQACPGWPADWWQRNCDTLWEDTDPCPPCLTEREQRIPPPP
jgi:hypothetical protein